MSHEVDHVKVLTHWRQYGEILMQRNSEGPYKLITGKAPSWDFTRHRFKIPEPYEGPFGDLVWNATERKNIFTPRADGGFVKREIYERDCKK